MTTATRGVSASRSRRAEIRQLIGTRQVATQEELRSLLADRGHDVTQATLSRDLAQIGARRAAQPGGGTYYELADAPRTAPLLDELVRTIDENGTLVVVHTTSGAAQVVAGILDRAKLPEVLGTIAGDDAIFIAPARGVSTTKLIRKLRERLAARA